MRGFMFSIEMLGAISIVIVAIAAMSAFSTEEFNETSLSDIMSANNAMLKLYDGDPEDPAAGAGAEATVHCRSFADFDPASGKIIGKRYCEEIG